MGKKKENSKKKPSRRAEVDSDLSDNDSMFDDTCSEMSTSVYSHVSGGGGRNGSSGSGGKSGNNKKSGEQASPDADFDASLQIVDDFESKFDQVLENIVTVKGVKVRMANYESLINAMMVKNCYDLLEDRKLTIQDIIESGLRRGTKEEVAMVAQIFTIVMITMGSSDYGDSLFADLYDVLVKIMLDKTSGGKAGVMARTNCAVALSFGCFITEVGIEKNVELISQLLTFDFVSLRAAANSDWSEVRSLLQSFQATCLDCVAFLSTTESDSFAQKLLQDNCSNLCRYLESPCLDLRVAAGECLALLFERCREVDEDYELDVLYDLYEAIQALATDSNKSRSKKDLRQQRSNFRQILKTIDGEPFGVERVRIGQEHLHIDSWKMKRYYDSFCSALGSGINLHLAQNLLLRDIFELGPVLVRGEDDFGGEKMSKYQKHYTNNVNRKAREMDRNRHRGKRCDFDY